MSVVMLKELFRDKSWCVVVRSMRFAMADLLIVMPPPLG